MATIQTPPGGIRWPSATNISFPSESLTGRTAFKEPSGDPIYICSVILENSVCPGKVGPRTPCYYGHGGSEKQHQGRYDLLPMTDRMEWVASRNGEVPKNRRPVEGGYEVNGEFLYHAAVTVDSGILVPGKTGVHLGGASCAYGNKEVVAKDNYAILCWK